MEISSIQNPRVKEWASLSIKKNRDRLGKFIVEGKLLLLEAIKGGAQVESIIYTHEVLDESVNAFLQATLDTQKQSVHSKQPELIRVSDSVLAKITETSTPQGICAVVRKNDVLIEEFLAIPLTKGDYSADGADLVVVVDGVQDPGNLGTIIRCADAVGASGVVLGKGTVDLFNAKTVRSTMGSLFHLPISVDVDLPNLLGDLCNNHNSFVRPQWIGTSLHTDYSCYDIDFKKDSWIIVGNEANGVSEQILKLTDKNVKIPIVGQAESLNVAMATTVLLYEAVRQRGYSQ